MTTCCSRRGQFEYFRARRCNVLRRLLVLAAVPSKGYSHLRTVRRRHASRMPYPETCPECRGAFRNTGTHYTARRSEVGRHVLLELGCQNTSRRYWWDFTAGNAAEDGANPARRASLETTLSAAVALNGTRAAGSNG